MKEFLEDHRRLLQLLIKNKVEFLLIGGYAVIFYGYERFTKDLDIWVKPDNENKQKILKSLKEFGIDEKILEIIETYNFEDAQVFNFGENPLGFDILTKVMGVEFSEAIKNKRVIFIEEQGVSVIPFKDLVINKMLSGRPQDYADVDVLQKINKYRNDPEPL